MKTCFLAAVVLSLAALIPLAAHSSNLWWNRTNSVPTGLYRIAASTRERSSFQLVRSDPSTSASASPNRSAASRSSAGMLPQRRSARSSPPSTAVTPRLNVSFVRWANDLKPCSSRDSRNMDGNESGGRRGIGRADPPTPQGK